MNKKSKKMSRLQRRDFLRKLVDQILNGEFVSTTKADPHRLYLLHDSVRREYERPLDIDWGAGMRASEMPGTYEKG